MVSTSTSSWHQTLTPRGGFAALSRNPFGGEEVKEGRYRQGKIIHVGPDNIIVESVYSLRHHPGFRVRGR